MREFVRFRVFGQKRDEILENARIELRKFLDIDDAEFPAATRIETEPYVVDKDGKTKMWRAKVEVEI